MAKITTSDESLRNWMKSLWNINVAHSQPYYKVVNLKLSLSLLLLTLVASPQDADWSASEIVAPDKLAAELNKPDPARHILFVGFPILYKGVHIPAAQFAGPCSKQEGLDLLSLQAKDLPRDAKLVVYCGCCPFGKCPNVRPAFKKLKEMGFTKIRVLELDSSLHADWVEKGYPVEK